MAIVIGQDINSLLRRSARSFYLTLKILPRPIRPQLSIGYLLARISDTICDTEAILPTKRLEVLDQFLTAVLEGPHKFPDLLIFIQHQAKPIDKELLEIAQRGVVLLHSLPEFDKAVLQRTLKIIVQGQRFDLVTFGQELTQPKPIPLRDEAELENYTYSVAGCVGELWTELCHRHLFPNARIDMALALQRAVRFGKALQLVNILRDLAQDLRRNRCYIPADQLAKYDLNPVDLLAPGNWPKFKPLYLTYTRLARKYFKDAWLYTRAIPQNQFRVRLACAWPILIGLKTLALLEASNPLDPSTAIKIPRSHVRSIILRTIAGYPIPGFWDALYRASGGLPLTSNT